MTSCSVSQEIDTKLGQVPTSQARPRDADHVRPSNLAARTLRPVEHTPSKFGHDPSPVRRGLVASVKCLCATSTFFSLSGPAVEQNKRSQSLVWVSTPQRGNLFCFLFIDPIILGRPLASQQRKLLFGVAVCACPRREPLVQSTRGHRRYSCAAAVIVCLLYTSPSPRD